MQPPLDVTRISQNLWPHEMTFFLKEHVLLLNQLTDFFF
jgi:hypothetical protein